MEKYALHYAEERPEWAPWKDGTSRKVWEELPRLVEEEKCRLLTDDSGTRIFMFHFYVELIQEAYRLIDDTAEFPFPSEESLTITLPQDHTRSLSISPDLIPYLDNPQNTLLPIIKLLFPENMPSALVLSTMMPRRLMEAAMLKTRNYLRSHGNKDYFQHKLGPQLQGKEGQLRDMLNYILTRPFDCLDNMEEAGDFSFYFWAYFCNMVRNDIKKKTAYLSEDIAILQSVYLIEILNSFYRTKAAKAKERELAFKNLESQLNKQPYLYALDKIISFTNNKGVPLLGKYSQDDLESWLKQKTTECEKNELPELLIIHGPNKEQWFVKKSRLLPLCAGLLVEARPVIRKAILKRWLKVLKEYRTEPAMENSEDFEKLLLHYTGELSPTLMAVLEDQKLPLVYMELEQTQEGVPESLRFFNKGKLIPLEALLFIKQKDLLADTRILLPFWYSIPFFTALMAFFKNRKRKRRRAAKIEADGDNRDENEAAPSSEKETWAHELHSSAKEIETKLVPGGYTPDSYLAELEGSLGMLINKRAREDLIEDIHSLIRARLRHTLRLQKNARITPDALEQITSNIIAENPALQRLSRQDLLHIYIKLYIIKLLLQIKTPRG
ncbi:MAG: hypothetical protein LBP93_03095 [Treponema sp.]|nr:hypothetical protein [Treponema sp.]